MADDREALRARFDEDALLYDTARPTYPAALFAAIDERLPEHVPVAPQVLEIGCGTGQATLPLARRGYDIVAVDLGADMARVARRKLQNFHNVEVVNADIEQWDPPAERFDLVVCATAFHWLDPATRYNRVARFLRPGGLLALIQTIHIAGPSDSFFHGAQRCYEHWDPATPPGQRLRKLTDLPATSDYGIEQADDFEDVRIQRFTANHRYTAEQYLDLLNTFSNHRALPPPNRKGLFACIRERINAEPNRTITKSVAFELSTALRR